MARVTVEDCLKQVDSRFSLVHLAVRRVLQLRSGAPLQMEPRNKEVVMALREIAAAKVTPANILELEQMKALSAPVAPAPTAQAKEPEEVSRAEVREILEEAAQFNTTLEFGDVEPFEEEDASKDEEE
jgi:DNA-directed RNA polymerase subunit omega